MKLAEKDTRFEEEEELEELDSEEAERELGSLEGDLLPGHESPAGETEEPIEDD